MSATNDNTAPLIKADHKLVQQLVQVLRATRDQPDLKRVEALIFALGHLTPDMVSSAIEAWEFIKATTEEQERTGDPQLRRWTNVTVQITFAHRMALRCLFGQPFVAARDGAAERGAPTIGTGTPS